MKMNNMKMNVKQEPRAGRNGVPAPRAKTPRFVDGYLAYLLARASHLVSRQFHAQLREAGLALPKWRVLATLADGDGRTIGELARMALTPQPTMTKIVDRMEAEGLVARVPAPLDRRSTLVRITSKGRSAAAPLIVRARSHESEVLRGLSASEATLLKQVLGRLIARCEGAQERTTVRAGA
jgi:DNA-binding MarR family transcriptional regulator